MTSSARVFAILDLFTLERPVWTADDMNQALGYTRPTGYRYVKELVDAGFLQKVGGAQYALGGRIIMLDYQLRQTDPVLKIVGPMLAGLVERSGLDAVLTNLINDRVVDTYRASASRQVRLQYERGRVRPPVRGAAAKVLLAFQSRASLERWYRSQAVALAADGVQSLAELRQILAPVRLERGYMSVGELDPGVGAYAVPLLGVEGEVLSALALVGRIADLERVGIERLRLYLQDVTQAFADQLSVGFSDKNNLLK